MVYPGFSSISGIGSIYQQNNLCFLCYVGDIQVYIGIMPNEICVDALTKLDACLADIGAWISTNLLLLSYKKTELVVFRVSDKIQLHAGWKISNSTFHKELWCVFSFIHAHGRDR